MLKKTAQTRDQSNSLLNNRFCCSTDYYTDRVFVQSFFYSEGNINELNYLQSSVCQQ